MADLERQPELFQEFSGDTEGAKVRRRRSLKPFLTKWQFTFSIEHLIISAILIIMLNVIFFALGVEQGKRNSKVTISASYVQEQEVVAETYQTAKELESEDKLEAEEALSQAVEESEVKEADIEEELGYTIQVASFKSEASADKEAVRLKQQGFFVKVIPSGNYKVVCVGNFPSREKANQNLSKLKKIYNDCFVRRL